MLYFKKIGTNIYDTPYGSEKDLKASITRATRGTYSTRKLLVKLNAFKNVSILKVDLNAKIITEAPISISEPSKMDILRSWMGKFDGLNCPYQVRMILNEKEYILLLQRERDYTQRGIEYTRKFDFHVYEPKTSTSKRVNVIVPI